MTDDEPISAGHLTCPFSYRHWLRMTSLDQAAELL
jgi:hypothetical protein